jgi:LmbE family N-acetylglucosaminyl deacetylase
MAKATADGHRVVLVTATRGEHGEVQPGVLGDGGALWQRREKELAEACRILGVARHEFLGYVDSGMMGTPENDLPASFWRADVDEAGRRLAAILDEEGAEVLTVYDEHGGYGHPDHIQVHRVGVRAAEMAGTPTVYMATMNRDHIHRLMEQAADFDVEDRPELPEDVEFGEPEARITTAVDVAGQIAAKREAMRAHASQIADNSFFLSLPPEAFSAAFGTEWYIRLGGETGAGPTERSLFPDG